MKKLLFIMDDSEAYLRNEVLRVYKEWGFKSSNVKYVEEWNNALGRSSLSLFGDISMVHLDLSDKKYLKIFAEMISDKKEKDNFSSDNWFGPALVITSTHAQGSKKIENLVTSSGGKVIKKAKPAEMKSLLLNRIKLNKETENFVDSYVGDDYQMLIGIVNQIEKLSDKEQNSMTPEEMIVRLPSRPGSVPPWEFINPMLDGNAKEAIDLYSRCIENSHILVTMQLARTKLQMLYRLKLLLMSGIWDSKKQAEVLKQKNGPNIWLTSNVAKKLNVETAEYLAKLALVTEADLKGYSNADPNTIFKNFIVTTTLAINKNKSFPLPIRK